MQRITELRQSQLDRPDPYEHAFRRKYGDATFGVFWFIAAAEVYEALYRIGGRKVIPWADVLALREDAARQRDCLTRAVRQRLNPEPPTR